MPAQLQEQVRAGEKWTGSILGETDVEDMIHQADTEASHLLKPSLRVFRMGSEGNRNCRSGGPSRNGP